MPEKTNTTKKLSPKTEAILAETREALRTAPLPVLREVLRVLHEMQAEQATFSATPAKPKGKATRKSATRKQAPARISRANGRALAPIARADYTATPGPIARAEYPAVSAGVSAK